MTSIEKFGLLGMLACLYAFNFVPYDGSGAMLVGCGLVFVLFGTIFMNGNNKEK